MHTLKNTTVSSFTTHTSSYHDQSLDKVRFTFRFLPSFNPRSTFLFDRQIYTLLEVQDILTGP